MAESSRSRGTNVLPLRVRSISPESSRFKECFLDSGGRGVQLGSDLCLAEGFVLQEQTDDSSFKCGFGHEAFSVSRRAISNRIEAGSNGNRSRLEEYLLPRQTVPGRYRHKGSHCFFESLVARGMRLDGVAENLALRNVTGSGENKRRISPTISEVRTTVPLRAMAIAIVGQFASLDDCERV